MGNFLLALLSASFFITIAAGGFWLLEEKQVLKKFSSGTKAFIWFLLILGLLIPAKPSLFQPLFEIPASVKTSGYKTMPLQQGMEQTTTWKGVTYSNNTAVLQDAEAEIGLDRGAGMDNGSGLYRIITAFFAGNGFLWLLFGLWAAGALACALRLIYREYCFNKAFKRWARPAEDPKVLAALDEVRAAAGCRFPIRVYFCPFLSSPVLKGLICPSVLIPEDYGEYSNIRLILAHELTHACRQDLWMKAAASFATVIHWFNPAVKLIGKEMSLWCELACDEAVLKGTDEETRIRYGMVLLNAARRAEGRNNKEYETAFSTPLFESARQIKKRVYACADGARKRKGHILIALSAIIILASGSVFRFDSGKAESVAQIQNMAVQGTLYDTPKADTITIIEDVQTTNSEVGAISSQIVTVTDDGVEVVYDYGSSERATTNYREDKMVPVSSTVAGGAPWCIKVYLTQEGFQKLDLGLHPIDQIYDETDEVLLVLVDREWTDADQFSEEAVRELAKKLGVPEDGIFVDVTSMSE